MPDIETQLVEVYLQPGEMFLARKPTIIRTILGSCVGVTFWSARLGIGALCHAMLPKCPNDNWQSLSPETGYRYVDFCIRDIARKLDESGVHRSEVEVKLFGGADVLPCSNGDLPKETVGSLNCETALKVLRAEGFRILASSLRGVCGVNIQFNTGNGEVHLHRLKQNEILAPKRRPAREVNG